MAAARLAKLLPWYEERSIRICTEECLWERGILPRGKEPPDESIYFPADLITDIWILDPALAEAAARNPLIFRYVIDDFGYAAPHDLGTAALYALRSTARRDLEMAWALVDILRIDDEVISGNIKVLAIGFLNGIASHDLEVARMAMDLPWVTVNSMTFNMKQALNYLYNITSRNPELARTVVGLPWVADDDLTLGDLWALEALSRNVESARALVSLPWFADGMTEGIADHEKYILSVLQGIASSDVALATMVAELPWFSDSDITLYEEGALSALGNIAEVDAALATMVAELPWFSDSDITLYEEGALSALGNIAEVDVALATMVAELPWFSDGMKMNEYRALGALSGITTVDTELASKLATSLNNQPRDLDFLAIEALWRIARHGADALGQLSSLPWFLDGIEIKEAVLLVILGSVVSEYPRQYDALLKAPVTPARTIFLPLAGEVNIWIVRNISAQRAEDTTPGVNLPPRFILDPPQSDEVLQASIEDASSISEDFMGIPFPVTDIILLTPPVDERFGGRNYGTHMTGYASSIPHETAHYYFTEKYFTPVWFVEGMANFLDAYIYDQSGAHNHLSERSTEVSEVVYSICQYGGEPIENIRHYNYILESVYGGDWSKSGISRCAYLIGENFLFAVYDAIGEDAMSAAVRELYLQTRESGRPATEEAIYNAFLKQTTYDKKDAFLDAYQTLHGGAFAFDDVDFEDDHGDEAGLATEIAVGETVEGALDYMFDFDYFKFPAEGGQRYRVNVDHESLRTSSVTMYSRDGTTRLGRSIDTPEPGSEVSPGVRILWTARRDGMYHVAVQNFGGKTGAYTLTIAPVDADEDD